MCNDTQFTANDFYNFLIQDNVINCTGQVLFELNNVTTQVRNLDAIGHLIQEWILAWANSKNIPIYPNPHTQEFPDYFLDEINSTNGQMEIKSFNYNATPAFDVADFFEYIDFLSEKPYKLYADYLILGYEMDKETGNITIRDVWLKKIWEVVGHSDKNYITCQIRNSNGVRRPYKIRPTSFHKNGRTFNSAREFLLQLQELLNTNSITKNLYNNWFDKIEQSHIDYYGKKIK